MKKGECSQETSWESSIMRSTVLKMSLLSTKYLRNPSMLGCQVPSPSSSLYSSDSSSLWVMLVLGVLRSFIATNLISSVMPVLSPGYCFLYLFLFFTTCSGVYSEQHKMKDSPFFLLPFIWFLKNPELIYWRAPASCRNEIDGVHRDETACCRALSINGAYSPPAKMRLFAPLF